MDYKQLNNNLTNSEIEIYESQIQSEVESQPEKKRWLVLFSFCTLTFTNAAAFVVYSPIIDQAQEYYQTSNSEILWLMNIFYVTFVFLGTPASLILDWRLDVSIWLSSFLNALGSWIKYLGGKTYFWALFGNFILSVAQLWSLGSPGVIAQRWFSSQQRLLATSISLFSNIMGFSFGYLTAAQIVKNDYEKINYYQFVSSFWMSAPFILCVLFFRNQPKNYKKATGQVVGLSMKQSLKQIYFNFQNFLTLIVLSSFLGISWTFTSVLANLLSPLGFTTVTIGYIGLIMNTCGTVGGLVSSIILEKQLEKKQIPNYDFFIKAFSSISMTCVLILSVLVIFVDNLQPWIIYIISAFIGLGFNAFVPFAAQAYVERIFPVSENIGFVSFFSVANGIGFIGNLISNQGLWVLSLLLAPFYLYMCFIYKTNLNRYKYEENDSKNLQSLK